MMLQWPKYAILLASFATGASLARAKNVDLSTVPRRASS